MGRVNRVAVLSRDKTDVSRGGGGVNDRGKRMGDWCLERMTLEDGPRIDSRELSSATTIYYIRIWHAPSKRINNHTANSALLYRLQLFSLWSSDGIMPDWGAIFENRLNYCDVKMQRLLRRNLARALLSCFRKYSRLLALAAIIVMWTDHDRLASKLSPNNLKVETCSTEAADVDRSWRLAVLREPKIISLVFDVFICMLLLTVKDRTMVIR